MEAGLLGDEKPAENTHNQGYQRTDVYRPLDGDGYGGFPKQSYKPVYHGYILNNQLGIKLTWQLELRGIRNLPEQSELLLHWRRAEQERVPQ